MHLGKPKPSDRERVICGLTRCPGVAVQVRTLAKNIRNVGTETIKCMHNFNEKFINCYLMQDTFSLEIISRILL